MRNVFPFVEKPADIEKVKSSNIYLAVADAEKGDLKKLKAMYKDGYVFGSEYLINGGYKLLGWYFDLKPYCKNYLVKLKHYGWKEYSTPNKTCLYKMIGRHNVLEIIEK